MAIIDERYLNLAVKSFDDADKYINIEPVSSVADQAVATLRDIKEAIIDFARENQSDIRQLYAAVTSESGSKQNYRMQNTDFAKSSFDEYIGKVITIPEAAKNGTISENLSLDAGFFERDRKFVISLFSNEENEPVPIPAEDAFEELKYMHDLTVITDEFCKQIIDKAAIVPQKTGQMDADYARRYETSIMAVRLMATSMIRFCSILLRHVVNNAAELYDHAMSSRPRWSKDEIPTISWNGDEGKSANTEENRWAIFV